MLSLLALDDFLGKHQVGFLLLYVIWFELVAAWRWWKVHWAVTLLDVVEGDWGTDAAIRTSLNLSNFWRVSHLAEWRPPGSLLLTDHSRSPIWRSIGIRNGVSTSRIFYPWGQLSSWRVISPRGEILLKETRPYLRSLRAMPYLRAILCSSEVSCKLPIRLSLCSMNIINF